MRRSPNDGRLSRLRLAGSLLAVSVLLGSVMGCDAVVVEQPAWGADVSRPVVHPFRTPERAREPQATDVEGKKRLEDTNKLLDDFNKRAQVAFTTDDAQKHLPGLESFYMGTGRYLELVDLYRKAYDLHGPTHYIGPRLAWAYMNIGENARARTIVDQALVARPNDAYAHFVDGYLIGTMRNANDPNVGLEVYRAWRRTLELDPAFVGPQGISAARIQSRLGEMRRLLTQQGLNPDAPPPEAPAVQAPPGETPPAEIPPGEAPPAEAPPAAATPTDATLAGKLVQAESLLAQGQYNEAGRLFDEVLMADPKSSRADVGRALAAWRSDTVARPNAEQMLRHVTNRPDLDARQAYELGTVFLRELKDNETALTLWRKAETLDPTFAQTVRLRQTIERVEK